MNTKETKGLITNYTQSLNIFKHVSFRDTLFYWHKDHKNKEWKCKLTSEKSSDINSSPYRKGTIPAYTFQELMELICEQVEEISINYSKNYATFFYEDVRSFTSYNPLLSAYELFNFIIKIYEFEKDVKEKKVGIKNV